MWTYIIVGLIALASLVAIGAEVKSVLNQAEQGGEEKVRAEWLLDIQKRSAAKRAASTAAALNLAADRNDRKAKSNANSKATATIITRVEYRNVCIDPGGLCLINAKVGGGLAAGCESTGAVPAAKPAR